METSIYADYNLTGIYTSDQKMGYKLYIYGIEYQTGIV